MGIVGWAVLAVVFLATRYLCNHLPIGRGVTIVIACLSSVATAALILLIYIALTWGSRSPVQRWEMDFAMGAASASIFGFFLAPAFVVLVRGRRNIRERGR